MNMSAFLCCVEAIVVDTVAGGMGDRLAVLEMLHKQPEEMTETGWGASDTAQAAARAMIGLAD